MTRRVVLPALAALLLPAPVAWAVGELAQKPGAAGCISETGTGGACRDGTALDGAFDLVASPDGKNLYVTANNADAVAVFDRDPATGALAQKPGTAGCASDTGTGGLCQDATALRSAARLAASPDGRNVYVAAGAAGAVAVFDRDPATGALTQKPGTAGCVSDDGVGCADGTALAGAFGVAISADGENVYVAAIASDAVVVLDRDPATGALTQKPGTAGCISDTGGDGCQNGTALDGPANVATSPDGENVYVASAGSDAVAVFDRDPATGALAQQRGLARCVSESGSGGVCADGAALARAAGVATSPDGSTVYVASQLPGAVAVLDRNPATGALTQKPGTAGCISDTGGDGCKNGTGLANAFDVVPSRDGRSVYVASAASSALTVFDRDAATGALSQKPGTAGCISDTGSGGCRDGTALGSALGIALSPDGSSLYVSSAASDAVAVLDRRRTSPTPPPPPPRPADTTAPTVSRLAFKPRRFRAGRRSRLRFTLSEPADVRIRIERARRHRRVGSLTRHDLPAGANTVRFRGRIGRRRLAAGRYRAVVTATDPAGNRSTPRRTRFTITRARGPS